MHDNENDDLPTDSEGWEDFITNVRDVAHRYIWAHGHGVEMESVLSDTLITFIQWFRRNGAPENVEAFVIKLAQRRIIDAIRRKVRPSASLRESTIDDRDVAKKMEAEYELDEFLRAHLDSEQVKIVKCKVRGFTQTEISTLLKLPKIRVRRQLAKARELLRVAFEGDAK